MSYNKIGTHRTTIRTTTLPKDIDDALCFSTMTTMTHVRYHNTDVVSWNDEEIRLNTGGWRTATTKKRMNQASQQFALGFSVFQRRGEWYISYAGVTVLMLGETVSWRRNPARSSQFQGLIKYT